MRLSSISRSLKQLGCASTLKLFLSRRKFKRILPSSTQVLFTPSYSFPIHYRHGTTDKYVIEEVLINEQYEPLNDMRSVATIIDAGANIGTASLYFLEQFPNARVIAIEPDPGNFEILARNVEQYGSRVTPLCSALWTSREELTLKYGNYRDGGEWSMQVALESGNLGIKVSGLSVIDIMSEYDLSTIDILKVDIEGAEKHIFSNLPAPWLWSAFEKLIHVV